MLNTFLYHVTAGSAVYRFIHIDRALIHNLESYDPIQITHSVPTWSDEPQDAEINVTVKDSIDLSEVLLTPPPYPIIVRIYEWLGESATPYYKGWIVRCRYKLTEPTIELHLKTVWHFFEREALSDSLSSVSRYSIYDPRAGIDVESLRVSATAGTFNDQRDVIKVVGITEPPPYYQGGFIRAPNQDKRTIIDDEIVGVDRIFTLSGGFALSTLDTGFPFDAFPGDDLLYSTWANKFASQTNNGESWGGWEFTPTIDPMKRGVI